MTAVLIAPGAYHIPHYLSLDEQGQLRNDCRDLIRGEASIYAPVLRGGFEMHVEMLCLGRHWNAKTNRYEARRTDYDGLLAPPIPDHWKALGRRIAATVGMSIEPDVCILNYYGYKARLGLHRDNSEDPRAIKAGIPVVSVSIGNTAEFKFGGLQRGDSCKSIPLESGDAFVFGGPSRLCFHGVSKVIDESAPPELEPIGRFNLTFRQSQLNQEQQLAFDQERQRRWSEQLVRLRQAWNESERGRSGRSR